MRRESTFDEVGIELDAFFGVIEGFLVAADGAVGTGAITVEDVIVGGDFNSLRVEFGGFFEFALLERFIPLIFEFCS